MDRRVKRYGKGVEGLRDEHRYKVHILEIVDTECVMVLYKVWLKYRRRWKYVGCKFTELLYWNCLVWDLPKEERRELFRLNGFDYDKIIGH